MSDLNLHGNNLNGQTSYTSDADSKKGSKKPLIIGISIVAALAAVAALVVFVLVPLVGKAKVSELAPETVAEKLEELGAKKKKVKFFTDEDVDFDKDFVGDGYYAIAEGDDIKTLMKSSHDDYFDRFYDKSIEQVLIFYRTPKHGTGFSSNVEVLVMHYDDEEKAEKACDDIIDDMDSFGEMLRREDGEVRDIEYSMFCEKVDAVAFVWAMRSRGDVMLVVMDDRCGLIGDYVEDLSDALDIPDICDFYEEHITPIEPELRWLSAKSVTDALIAAGFDKDEVVEGTLKDSTTVSVMNGNVFIMYLKGDDAEAYFDESYDFFTDDDSTFEGDYRNESTSKYGCIVFDGYDVTSDSDFYGGIYMVDDTVLYVYAMDGDEDAIVDVQAFLDEIDYPKY